MSAQALGPASTGPDQASVTGGQAVAVSVVICAYTMQRWAQTKAAVASVLAQRPAPAQVLVVIDQNPELAVLASRELAGVTVLSNGEAPGLSGARNTGLRAATQPITAFLDDDAAARPGWLAALIAPYDRAEVAATGGGIHPLWARSRPAWFAPEFDWVVGCSYVGLPDTCAAVRNPIGANMSFRTRAALESGGFSAEIGRVAALPRGCEETELAIRVTAHLGAMVMYVPQAVVDHHVGPERERVTYFLRRCWHEGRSKAAVVRLVGASSGLERERRQTAVVIPAGLRRDLRSLLRGQAAGGMRMAVSVGGLGAAAAGYLAGRVLLPLGRRSAAASTRPAN
jgi:cellulose synthase/poly-beta-1,6-N-acetylglucosamine synthase-like glycosyltransferase